MEVPIVAATCAWLIPCDQTAHTSAIVYNLCPNTAGVSSWLKSCVVVPVDCRRIIRADISALLLQLQSPCGCSCRYRYDVANIRDSDIRTTSERDKLSIGDSLNDICACLKVPTIVTWADVCRDTPLTIVLIFNPEVHLLGVMLRLVDFWVPEIKNCRVGQAYV